MRRYAIRILPPIAPISSNGSIVFGFINHVAIDARINIAKMTLIIQNIFEAFDSLKVIVPLVSKRGTKIQAIEFYDCDGFVY